MTCWTQRVDFNAYWDHSTVTDWGEHLSCHELGHSIALRHPPSNTENVCLHSPSYEAVAMLRTHEFQIIHYWYG